MDISHRLMRKSIEAAIRKALEDMGVNAQRSVRSLIDLGLLFSGSESQKWFFKTAQELTKDETNAYFRLLAGLSERVNHQTLTVSGINIGYNSLVYGAGKLRHAGAEAGKALPWVLLLDAAGAPARFAPFADEIIAQGSRLGIYFYAIRGFAPERTQALCKLAAAHSECVFFLDAPACALTEESVEPLSRVHNLLVALHISPGEMPGSGENAAALQLLRRHRMLYGYTALYSDKTLEHVISRDYTAAALAAGCGFGLYCAARNASASCRERLYGEVCRSRYRADEGIVLFEAERDMEEIGERLLSVGGGRVLSPTLLREGEEISLLRLLQSADNKRGAP